MGLNDVGVAPDSWLLTSKGPRQAGELVGKPSVIEQLGDSSGLWVNALESVKVVYRDWETDRKSTSLNSSHSGESRMPSSA